MEPYGIIIWTLFWAISSLFWLWVCLWGGADKLEGTFLSGIIVDIFAPRWNTNGLKIFAWLFLILGSGWFVLGLFKPELRIALWL